MDINSASQSFWRRFKKNRLAVIGGVIILVLFIAAVLAPMLAPYDPAQYDSDKILQPPSSIHLLGTDDRGRDVFSRLLYGTRISLSVGFAAVFISIFLGIIIGSLAGFYGGKVDFILMRLVEIFMTIPAFFLILAIIAFLGPSLFNIMVVIGLTGWTGIARLVRAEFLSLKERDFTEAAEALGIPKRRIIFHHLLPNAMAPIFVAATLGVAGAILTESALSFLGMGVQPPTASWGNMLTDGKATMEIAWWLTVFPGLAILVTVLAYNLLGEGLRDVLDPRLR